MTSKGSDQTYVQAGLRLSTSHIPHCWKSYVVAQIFFTCRVNFHNFVVTYVDFFSKLTFSQKNPLELIRDSNALNPDQNRHSVGPDLGLKRLEKVINR